MRKRLYLSLLAFGLSTFLLGSATMAWFTHDVTVPASSFTSGNLDLTVTTPAPVVWTGSYANMAPGQTVTTDLTIVNSGTIDLKYRFFADVTGDALLVKTLTLTVRKGPDTLYEGPLNGMDLGHAVIRDGCNALVPAAGPTSTQWTGCTGTPSNSEVLTLSVTLPSSAGNELASKNAQASFVFRATQVENPGWEQTSQP